MAKVFVLDTSVILHDLEVLRRFEEHDIAVPTVVLEELDHFKKGNGTLSHHARDFIRRLDEVSVGRDLRTWLPLDGPTSGSIRVISDHSANSDIAETFGELDNDARILGAALALSRAEQENGGRPVILVSKDTNLRVKARSLGIPAEDYENVRVEDVQQLYRGRSVLQFESDELIGALFSESGLAVDQLGLPAPPPDHHYFILRGPTKSALAVHRADQGKLAPVMRRPAYGIEPRNAEQTFALHAILDESCPLVSLSGAAGTGKTLLALAGALEQRRDFLQIYLARPVVPLSNKDLGYLPGDIDSKISPYMQPLWDNLGVIKTQYAEQARESQQIDNMIELEKLQVVPLAFIRGRSFNRIIFIVDEAQNLTPHEVKTIITRAGEGTKIVFTGDIFQIDTPYLDARSNGLSYLIDRMRGNHLYAHVNLERGERSELANVASKLL